MKKYHILFFCALLIVNFSIEAKPMNGPDSNPDPGEREDQINADRLRKKQEEEARIRLREAAFDLRTKNARMDIERRAISNLMSSAKRIEAKAMAEANDGELLSATENILSGRVRNKTKQLNINISEYSDVDLNKVQNTYENVEAAISNFIYAHYMASVQSEQDKVLGKIKNGHE